jgi:hypothetical protein
MRAHARLYMHPHACQGDTPDRSGKPARAGDRLVLRFGSSHRLKRGRYTLTVIQRLEVRRVVTKSALLVR